MTAKDKVKTKAPVKKKAVAKRVKAKNEPAKAPDEYFEGIGRRKTAVARVRLYPGTKDGMSVNGKDFRQYFPTLALQKLAQSSLASIKYPKSLRAEIRVGGGGIKAQAEAIRLGSGRALVKLTDQAYKILRKLGYLTRDPRMRERKKFGLKRARRAPQWRKR
ncbi:MAG: 30S ribosomal protein S9 [bacterium]|nr:30S ribosomal protein S9 [bacterium]